MNTRRSARPLPVPRAVFGLLAAALVAALVGAPAGPAGAACVTDDTGTEVCLDHPPTRAVSLYGAFTELLWEVGAGPTLVARTKNDDTIPAVRELPSVGTGLRPNVEYLLAVRPDLVVSRAGHAAGQAVTALRARGLTVAAFDPRGLDDLYATLDRLGTLFGRAEEAGRLEARLREGLARVAAVAAGAPRRLRVVYEVRAEPLTVAGADSLVDELIRTAGGADAVEVPKKLVMLDVEALLRLDPDAYLVQEGPMNRNPTPPGERPHLATLRAVREGRVLTVDEHRFARPGPQVAAAAEELSRFLYPELWAARTP